VPPAHRFASHTGEVEIEIEAPTERDVFAEAARALAELMDGEDGEPATRDVRVEAADRPALLAEWLGELAFLAETEGLVPERVAALELGEGALRARVEGRTSTPRHLVKAVTYHDLTLEERDGSWFARVVLDV
jgi:SHS2 domain-containing protein